MKTKIKKIFARVRWGWIIAAAALLYLISAGGVYYLYWTIYSAMMNVWGVTEANVIRAPGGVQFLYRWSNVMVQLLQSGALIASTILLGKMSGVTLEKKQGARGVLFGAGMGAAGIGILWSVLMLLGCVRLGWRITNPAFSVNTFALLLTVSASAFAQSVFLYGMLYAVMKKHLPIWAAVGAAALFRVLMQGMFSPMAIVNYALTAVLCCLLTERRGIGAAAAFCFSWNFLDQAVFGFAGNTAALYETYPVNLYWLNGGNSGIVAGAMMSIVLIAMLFLLLKPFKKVRNKG